MSGGIKIDENCEHVSIKPLKNERTGKWVSEIFVPINGTEPDVSLTTECSSRLESIGAGLERALEAFPAKKFVILIKADGVLSFTEDF